MKTPLQILQDHREFGQLPPRYLEQIASEAEIVEFTAGELLLRQGEEADFFFVVLDGKVAIESFTHEHGTMVIETLAKNDFVGLSWLFPPHRWQFDARAWEQTTLLRLNGAKLRQQCAEDPQLAYPFLMLMLRDTYRRLQNSRLQKLDVYERRQ